MIYYLAGAMSGLVDYNFPYFFHCEKLLKKKYPVHKFINPARESLKLAKKTNRNLKDIPKEEFLKKDFELIHRADGVILLEGWEKSEGANKELQKAKDQYKDIMYFYILEHFKICLTRIYLEKINKNQTEYNQEYKYDDGKLDWNVLPWDEIEHVVRTLNIGKIKYDVDSWKNVKPFKLRYRSALVRHFRQMQKGKLIDEDTGTPTLSCLICDALFLLHDDLKEAKEKNIDWDKLFQDKQKYWIEKRGEK